MKYLLTLLACICLTAFSLSAATVSDDENDQKEKDTKLVDDWQYKPSALTENRLMAPGARPMVGSMPPMVAIPSPPKMAAMTAARTRTNSSLAAKRIGLAVGGAKDRANFLQNLENGYLPKYDSLTYEGLFYDYYFDTGIGTGTCRELFCPSFATAVTTDLYSGATEYYLSVGLNSGLTEASFQRKKLNIVVVLDISGSMGSPFDSYYYDQSGTTHEKREAKSKMQLANEAIVAMMQHLKGHDRFGVVLFDDRAYRAKPLRLVSRTDMKAIADHILDLHEQGGTNWQAGFAEGVKLFDSLDEGMRDRNSYENRIIFLTDAMPNRGELGKDGLFGMIRSAADKGIYTSIIGVGVDFNPELVEAVTKTRGANYFSIQKAAEFKKRLVDEFDFMVTPLVFDLELFLESDEYAIDGVFGSPEADAASGELMKISTLFPSSAEEEQVKGGVVLVRLKKTGTGNGPVKLTVRYKNRAGKKFSVSDTVTFSDTPGFANPGIRKAVLLTEYVSLIKNWLIDAHKGCNDTLDTPRILLLHRCGLINPGTRPEIAMLPTWERKSCPLEVSDGYRKFFTLFRQHFVDEMQELNDPTLEKELKILEILSSTAAVQKGKTIDDWKIQ